jgi:hypothetical protein
MNAKDKQLEEIGQELRNLARKRLIVKRQAKARDTIDSLPAATLTKIQDDLNIYEHNKKEIARRYQLPHHIIMYIWVHY